MPGELEGQRHARGRYGVRVQLQLKVAVSPWIFAFIVSVKTPLSSVPLPEYYFGPAPLHAFLPSTTSGPFFVVFTLTMPQGWVCSWPLT